MVVQHNLTAMNANRMFGLTQNSLSKSTEKLSSGYRVNRAADDAAGLAISEKMRKQTRGLTQASRNAQDGISAVQTAEGALTEVHDMLQRMNELANQSANGTNSSDDRTYIQSEVDALVKEIDRVSETTKFNEIYLLKGDPDDVAQPVGLDAAATGTGITATAQTGAGTTASPYSLTATATIADSVKFGKEADANAQITVGGKVYSLSKYANVDELADAISSNSKVSGVALSKEYDTSKNTATFTDVDSGLVAGTILTSSATTFEEDGIVKFDATQIKAPAVGAGVGKTFDLTIAGETMSGIAIQTAMAGSESITANADNLKAVEDALTAKFGSGNVKNVSGVFEIQTAPSSVATISATKPQSKLSFNLHVGAESAIANKIGVDIDAMSADGLGVSGLKVTSEQVATEAIDTIAEAIKHVSAQRSNLGAVQNRLEHTVNNLNNIVENTQSAESQIRDTDMATEMVKYSNANILAQAGQSMLAQANQSNQGVLSLLG